MDSVSDFESGGCGFESRRSCLRSLDGATPSPRRTITVRLVDGVTPPPRPLEEDYLAELQLQPPPKSLVAERPREAIQ